jgi:hypothetical protein
MYFKLIACNVFFREVCFEVSKSRHIFDIDFTEKGDHDRPDSLRQILQDKIESAEASGKPYDAILLAYGLCGNALSGISARKTRIVIPRAHDCCTIFLGSREKFRTYFADNPSRPFSSTGYMERGDSYKQTSEVYTNIGLNKTYEEYVALYGEENARYLMETLSPAKETGKEEEIFFIEMPETAFLGFKEKCRREAEEEGKQFISVEGDTRLIRSLVHADWTEEDFLILEAGKKITPLYDWDEVIRAG